MKHVWRIKRQYFEELSRGEKSLEVRVGYGFVRKVRAGDQITFENYGRNEFDVIRVARYHSFREMLASESADRMLPGFTKEQALRAYQNIYSADRDAWASMFCS